MGTHRLLQFDGRAYDVSPRGLAAIACGGKLCANFATTQVTPDAPPELVERKFRQMGWEVGRTRRKHQCPDCQAAARELREKRRTMQKTEEGQKAMAMGKMGQTLEKLGVSDTHKMEVRPATPRETRLVHVRLAEVFDEERGQYLKGYDDARVAVDLDLPRALVTKLREESGLMIKGDPVITGLRQDMKDLRSMLEDLERRINELEEARKS